MKTVSYVDLDLESRAALEFDALLEWVASLAATPMGADSLRGLLPRADAEAIAAAGHLLAEVRLHLDERGRLVPAGLGDPRPALAELAVAELCLAPARLRELARVALAAAELADALEDLDARDWPGLAALGRGLPDLRREARPVLDGLDPEGGIRDDASPELAAIRRSRTRTGERLRGMLERMLHDPDSEHVIQDDFITQRNGRYVIPLRSDAPRPLHGIVHAISSSGATRFVEPLETVELNNELVRLGERELEELERILAAWTEGFRRRREDVAAVIAGLTAADDLQARGLFGRESGGVPAAVAEGGPLVLTGLLHPLLDRRLRQEGVRAVPLDLSLDSADRVLVLSGPNTGGKTVALKTLGLAVLMAQSGLPVPARQARLPLYRQVRADIGDHQSIQADLSTFSAHVAAVRRFVEGTRPPALLLFDEIGTGTEPAEGAALAQAILESLRVPGLTTVATTHLAALKAWAFMAEGASCAAMEFDLEALRPTYRILMGAAGTSAGLDIAARLGLPAPLVERARELLGPDASRSMGYLDRLREAVADVEARREALALGQAELTAERERLRARTEHEAERRRREAKDALDSALEELRRLGRRELATIHDEQERRRFERDWARAETRLAAEQRRHKTDLAGAADDERQDWGPPGELGPGDRVWVRSLGKEGRVASARGEQVEVILGNVTFRLPRADLRVPPGSAGRGAAPARAQATPGPAAAPIDEPAAPRELKLVGKRVEEAVEELDRFLDGAVVAGHDEVRVVHGHGTGRLRTALRSHLRGHPQVRSLRSGGPGEGGDGATIVTLR